MAFVNRNQAVNNNNQGNNDSWKAKAFINIYVASKDGSRKKLVGVPLRDGKGYEAEAKLLEFLRAGAENVEKFAGKLVIDFQEVTEKEFDLS